MWVWFFGCRDGSAPPGPRPAGSGSDSESRSVSPLRLPERRTASMRSMRAWSLERCEGAGGSPIGVVGFESRRGFGARSVSSRMGSGWPVGEWYRERSAGLIARVDGYSIGAEGISRALLVRASTDADSGAGGGPSCAGAAGEFVAASAIGFDSFGGQCNSCRPDSRWSAGSGNAASAGSGPTFCGGAAWGSLMVVNV